MRTRFLWSVEDMFEHVFHDAVAFFFSDECFTDAHSHSYHIVTCLEQVATDSKVGSIEHYKLLTSFIEKLFSTIVEKHPSMKLVRCFKGAYNAQSRIAILDLLLSLAHKASSDMIVNNSSCSSYSIKKRY